MIKESVWRADIEKGAVILEKKLKNDPDLKAQLDTELYKCSLLKEIEEEKEKERIKRHR